MSSPSMIVMVVMMCMALAPLTVTASSSCLYYSTSTNRSVDLSPLSGRMISASIGQYIYSLYPCGLIASGFCSNPAKNSTSPTFFCQYDTRYIVNNTLAYQMDNSTQVQNVKISNNSINVVYQSGHLCRNNPRIANITYTCSCQSNTTLSVIESPICTYNAVVQSKTVCSSFGIICPVMPTVRPATTSPPTTAPITPAPTSRPSRQCNFDTDCTDNSYCSSGYCYPSLNINSTCSTEIKSRKQCFNGACENNKCVPLVPHGNSCSTDVYYPCVEGDYCKASNNNTYSGTCQKTLPNGQQCTTGFACDSGYCNVPANSKTGTCETNPLAKLVAAAALGLVAIILIAIGGCVFMGVSICCCCYRFWKPRPVVVHHHEPAHVQQYHAPYRQLQDGYTRV